ncbi:hypothetical protein [Frankia sp. Cr1]|uniref:hypothetical protein n=1 Tax=Frankia sp. Cr1 TaxID=3073931 RepID=UPI002AD382EF|nr:hypothetical protein [Frankia sp. Cr1]
MAADETFRFIIAAERATADLEIVDLLHSDVRRLAAAYPTEATALVGQLLSAQRAAFRLLDGPGAPDQVRDLYFLAAVTCGLLARAGVDLSQPQTAQIYARAAFLCADRAAHPGLRTWIRIEQARVAYWSGSPHEALHYLSAAAGDAASVRGSMPAHLAVQEARAYAAIGDADSARSALVRASDARDNARSDDLDEIGGELTFPVAVQLFVGADALSLLSDHSEAERAAQDAVSAFEAPDARGASYGSKAGARIDLALARARQGEIEGTREALQPVFDIAPERRNHGMRTLLQRVHGALVAPGYLGSANARHVAAEIEACYTPIIQIKLPE